MSSIPPIPMNSIQAGPTGALTLKSIINSGAMAMSKTLMAEDRKDIIPLAKNLRTRETPMTPRQVVACNFTSPKLSSLLPRSIVKLAWEHRDNPDITLSPRYSPTGMGIRNLTPMEMLFCPKSITMSVFFPHGSQDILESKNLTLIINL
ncbi:hypothetical protein MJO28_004782 [Puccinia striiformis f. sp. tritici]|uniref:Uncharacterized protein n=2 Tax=Puccinia striiformis f. sp. tritici TaxID=168172 RepID=A0A0L0VNG9_9BASI|nr:hypothetical protein Pst134EA_009020 [Puccinia striiformis f. sp. tritici]KAI9609581.1 hypothetical protein H4Q26_007541 [Puccinia striiformis f. sp. tritici PST-130]KNF00545.1 hypothetical protein PSTG_06237 [Puccinia striiformis f. sp. tritici PST-78]KAH9457725.1 hypothetical protein Pst134EB_010042 [Puccinia striiformis f. sp. tritici]KAH9468477.1 hypothetical protein Pst134EA_009020 [Puccinia striiformis f. sp. tritici]KAI7954382.1 hypothetical protein MJO28_004782 [Puccinia striiformis